MFIDSHLPPSGYQSSLYVSFDLRHYIFDIAKQHWQFYKGIYSYWWAIAHASVRRPTFIGVAMLPSREHMVCDGLCGEMIGTETIRMTIEVKRCVIVLRRAKIMFGIRAWVGYHDHDHQNRDWVGLAEAAEPLACIRSPTFALTLKNLSTQLIHQLIDQSQKKKKRTKIITIIREKDSSAHQDWNAKKKRWRGDRRRERWEADRSTQTLSPLLRSGSAYRLLIHFVWQDLTNLDTIGSWEVWGE